MSNYEKCIERNDGNIKRNVERFTSKFSNGNNNNDKNTRINNLPTNNIVLTLSTPPPPPIRLTTNQWRFPPPPIPSATLSPSSQTAKPPSPSIRTAINGIPVIPPIFTSYPPPPVNLKTQQLIYPFPQLTYVSNITQNIFQLPPPLPPQSVNQTANIANGQASNSNFIRPITDANASTCSPTEAIQQAQPGAVSASVVTLPTAPPQKSAALQQQHQHASTYSPMPSNSTGSNSREKYDYRKKYYESNKLRNNSQNNNLNEIKDKYSSSSSTSSQGDYTRSSSKSFTTNLNKHNNNSKNNGHCLTTVATNSNRNHNNTSNNNKYYDQKKFNRSNRNNFDYKSQRNSESKTFNNDTKEMSKSGKQSSTTLVSPSSSLVPSSSSAIPSTLNSSSSSSSLMFSSTISVGTSQPSKADTRCDTEELFTKKISWIRCSPADPYYRFLHESPNLVEGTPKLNELQIKFEYELINRAKRVIDKKPPFQFPQRKAKIHPPHNHSSSCSSDDDDDDNDNEEDTAFEELQRKQTHPWRLHSELWYNDIGEMNDGPLCRCSAKAKRTGIRHGIYPGEKSLITCNKNSNNSNRLYHYRLNITPLTNYTSKFPTKIVHDSHEFIFEGFSILAHSPMLNYPPCKLIRFNIEYTITLVEEKFPTNFTIKDIDLVTQYIFKELLELVDIDWKAYGDKYGCERFHVFPRFSRLIDDDNGKELLSANVILNYLLSSNVPLINENDLEKMSDQEWTEFAKKIKGMIVTYPGMKPCSLRVDQIDRESSSEEKNVNGETSSTSSAENQRDNYPVIVHFGIRPPQLSYAGNPNYQKAWRDYVKFRHLLANKPKVSFTDRQTLAAKEEKLQEMRMQSNLKRDVIIVLSSKGFYQTGLYCDVIQHALLLPVVSCHLRFHQSLTYLENILDYTFKDRYLLQLALTHPSYRENFGTNPDHARNSLTNCGIRQPQYGDRSVHFANTRKRGINMLINIMSRFGCNEETTSNIIHNERLEFLGDAVVEFLSSIHLYFMFPDLEEGGLATYRAAIVQNQHLAMLAKTLQLEKFMLYAHGSDLCHDLELRHAMANCFEALMGALFLDGDINVADKVFSNTLFGDDKQLLDIWCNYNKHPLQRQHPEGDRHYLDNIPRLKELNKFEDITGIEFTHMRLLARAFTHRSVGYNNLTLGSNQRMEFLGDTVLQLVSSEYLYKFFPEHHEGHLSLLRSSLVNNKTQAVVCDDLGMTQYAIYNYAKGELKTKDRADLLEAFLGALYVDKGIEYCKRFCEVCFFPRLEDFIMNQDWNDPKSKLQQCCLTLRSIDGGEPDIPVYKVIESMGPTNTRVYKVAVYFRDERLETGKGHSIQEAEMNAAANALNGAKSLFPQLNHQKRIIERSLKQQEPPSKRRKHKSVKDEEDYIDKEYCLQE